jgi:hypothetical protein
VDVPAALRSAGAVVEVHDEHYPQDQEDVDWLPKVGARGWLVLTKDKAIRRNELEINALMTAGVGAFILSAGGLSGPSMGAVFVKALTKMLRIAATRTRPFVAAVTAAGDVNILRGGERRGGIKRDR